MKAGVKCLIKMKEGYLMLEALLSIILVGSLIIGGYALIRTVYMESPPILQRIEVEKDHFNSLLEKDYIKSECTLAFDSKLTFNGSPFRNQRISDHGVGQLYDFQKQENVSGEVSSSLLLTYFSGVVVSYYEAVSRETPLGIEYSVTRYGPELGDRLEPTNLLTFQTKDQCPLNKASRYTPRFRIDQSSTKLTVILPSALGASDTLSLSKKFKPRKVI